MEQYLVMNPIYRAPRSAPKGYKHWDSNEPLPKIEWGFFLLRHTLKFIFFGNVYKAKHMREELQWKQKAAEKIEGVDIALELLASIILQLVFLVRKLATEKRKELMLYVRKFLKKNRTTKAIRTSPTSIQSYLNRRIDHGFKARNILRDLEFKSRYTWRNIRMFVQSLRKRG